MPAARVWRARAFGLDLGASFAIPGLDSLPASSESRSVSLELVDSDDLDRGWAAEQATLIVRQRRPAMRLEHHARLGYRLTTARFGVYFLAQDGSRVRCAPPRSQPWRWQRFLTGQVLPLAAVFRGLEPFHASAVGIDGQAIAFVGRSGAGKTSIAINVLLRGASLVTDDVLVIEPGADAGRLLAHPGPGLVNVRHAENGLIGDSARTRLGPAVGHDSKGVRLQVERVPRALPLGAVYFLQREAPREKVLLAELCPPDPRPFLAATFNFAVRTPERMANQLDVCARLANTVPTFTALVPSSVSARELACAVESHALSVLGDKAPGSWRRDLERAKAGS